VGDSLEALYPDRLEDLAPRLAENFLNAGDEPRAVFYDLLAGKAAQRIFANPEAILYYQRALKLIRANSRAMVAEDTLIDLYRSLGRVLELSGRYADALAHYQAMEADALAAGSQPLELAALLARGTVQSTPTVLFNPAQAQPASQRALDLARALYDRAAESKVLWNLLLLNALTNQSQKALEYGEESLAIARELDLKEQIAYTLNDLSSFVSYQSGDMHRILEMLEEARAIWQSLNNLPMLADTLSNTGIYDFIVGDFDKHQQHIAEAVRISDSIHNASGQAFSHAVLAFVPSQRGLADQAFSDIDQSITSSNQVGFLFIQNITLSLQAMLYGIFGAPQLGIPLAQKAIEVGRGVSIWQPYAYATLAYLQVLTGDLDAAEAALDASGKDGLETEVILFSPLFTTATAELHLARRRNTVLLDFLTTYLDRLRIFKARGFLPNGLYYYGIALQSVDRRSEARSAFEEAVLLADELQIHPIRWKVRAALAGLSGAEEARRWRTEAGQVVRFLAEHAGSPELKASFVALPEVCQVLAEAKP
jgi:tetratricopeptide (TPR) repeat protein